MNQEVKQLYVWAIAGKQRLAIIKSMDKPLTATLIKKRTNIKVTNISDILREMERKKLTTVLNPKDKRNRVYELTNLGNLIRKEVIDL